jgi:hypothetical protein
MRTLIFLTLLTLGSALTAQEALAQAPRGQRGSNNVFIYPDGTQGYYLGPQGRSNYYYVPSVTDGRIGQWYNNPPANGYSTQQWGRNDYSGWDQSQNWNALPPGTYYWRYDRR